MAEFRPRLLKSWIPNGFDCNPECFRSSGLGLRDKALEKWPKAYSCRGYDPCNPQDSTPESLAL